MNSLCIYIYIHSWWYQLNSMPSTENAQRQVRPVVFQRGPTRGGTAAGQLYAQPGGAAGCFYPLEVGWFPWEVHGKHWDFTEYVGFNAGSTVGTTQRDMSVYVYIQCKYIQYIQYTHIYIIWFNPMDVEKTVDLIWFHGIYGFTPSTISCQCSLQVLDYFKKVWWFDGISSTITSIMGFNQDWIPFMRIE